MRTTSFRSNGTIRRKLLLLATISVTLALVLACSVFAAYGVVSLHNAKWQQLESQATLLALNSTAAVEFADTAQADRLLAALRSEPSITSAALCSVDGGLIGSYPNREVAEVAFNDAVRLPAGNRLLVYPIISSGETLGYLKFHANVTAVAEAVFAARSDCWIWLLERRRWCRVHFAARDRRADRPAGFGSSQSGGRRRLWAARRRTS